MSVTVHRGFPHYCQSRTKASTHNDLLFRRLLHVTHGYYKRGSHAVGDADDTAHTTVLLPVKKGDITAVTSGL